MEVEARKSQLIGKFHVQEEAKWASGGQPTAGLSAGRVPATRRAYFVVSVTID
jgi:hypothetical protein